MTTHQIDNFLGGFYGVCIGDCLGAPFEFAKSSPKVKYTGVFTDELVKVQFQFTAMILNPHAITDDSEMTIQLLSSIVDNKGKYIENDVIKRYLDWANLKSTPLGKNTRALMKGVTTVNGFRSRQLKVDITNITHQSNGSLMRCLPLVLLKDWKKYSDIDCSLTNNNIVNKTCNLIYLGVIRHYMYGESLTLDCKFKGDLLVVKTMLKNVINNKIVDVSTNKGWVVHALYVALMTFFNTNSFDEGMDYIHKHFFGTPNKPSDTDTVMAITGGLIGSYYGYNSISQERNTAQNLTLLTTYFNSNVNKDRPKLTTNLLKDLTKMLK